MLTSSHERIATGSADCSAVVKFAIMREDKIGPSLIIRLTDREKRLPHMGAEYPRAKESQAEAKPLPYDATNISFVQRRGG